MPATAPFLASLSAAERRLLAGLDTPARIQGFLDSVPYSTESVYRSPRQVLRDRLAHCFDGALFAAAALRLIGHPPLILEMLPDDRDDDHLLALFKVDGHWGAIAKSNFAGLRYREPIHRGLRELVLSYFEQYYNVAGEKTLRGYTVPLDLAAFDAAGWMTGPAALDGVADRLDTIRRYPLLTPRMVAGLAPVDGRLYAAGLQGADEAGLFRPGDAGD
ncbi:MAG: hypothetical protein R6X35_01995 [Candidatus Krumholzibacteriia bacterium]